jgi:hypothetical protein
MFTSAPIFSFIERVKKGEAQRKKERQKEGSQGGKLRGRGACLRTDRLRTK